MKERNWDNYGLFWQSYLSNNWVWQQEYPLHVGVCVVGGEAQLYPSPGAVSIVAAHGAKVFLNRVPPLVLSFENVLVSCAVDSIEH